MAEIGYPTFVDAMQYDRAQDQETQRVIDVSTENFVAWRQTEGLDLFSSVVDRFATLCAFS